MHSQEWHGLVDCCGCGSTVAPESDRAFAVDDDVFLCFECAIARGGVYDAEEERWSVAPTIVDLPDERRPHP